MTMIERASEAVLKTYEGYGREMPDRVGRDIAHAVLLAVREPDERVIEAGMSAPDHQTWCDDSWYDAKNPAGYFTAMIDAILEGSK